MINMARRLDTHEPYVLATQVEQVYYVNNTKESNWKILVMTKPRDLYDLSLEDIKDKPNQEMRKLALYILNPI